jgi:hypothetical protein
VAESSVVKEGVIVRVPVVAATEKIVWQLSDTSELNITP